MADKEHRTVLLVQREDKRYAGRNLHKLQEPTLIKVGTCIYIYSHIYVYCMHMCMYTYMYIRNTKHFPLNYSTIDLGFCIE